MVNTISLHQCWYRLYSSRLRFGPMCKQKDGCSANYTGEYVHKDDELYDEDGKTYGGITEPVGSQGY